MKQVRIILCPKQSTVKMRCFFILSLCLSIYTLTSASFLKPQEMDSDLTNDGPYIFLVEDILRIKWIENSQLKEEELTFSNFDDFKRK